MLRLKGNLVVFGGELDGAFWSFLGHVNMCLKLHCVEFQLLF